MMQVPNTHTMAKRMTRYTIEGAQQSPYANLVGAQQINLQTEITNRID